MKNPKTLILSPDKSLLLVIDLQEKFVPYLKHKNRVLRSAQLLLRTAKVMKIPIIVTEHNPKGIGPTVEEIAGHLTDVEMYSKHIFGCFGDEAIKKAVTSKTGVKNILITGCETHICVMQTSLAALQLGYNVHVAADGVSSRTELDWNVGLDRIREAGAVISTAEMIAYELLKRSDTPEFKKLLPVFKEWDKKEQ
jgi:nicotinamidase-related amidase